jgi:hypothetical protein
MLPDRDNDISTEYEFIESPTKTYAMQLDGDRIRGKTDERKAMEQAIYKILLTERYQYLIYSWNYGIELKDLFGKPISYCCVELERRIKEALLQDTRITNVYDFEFENPKFETVLVKFTADTIFGEIDIIKEVKLNNV